MDLSASLTPYISKFLKNQDIHFSGIEFWARWRARQRVEQYQDNILMLGHSGYLETCRRALIYTLRSSNIRFTDSTLEELMEPWYSLIPFQDAVKGIRILREHYRIVALSNGNLELLKHLITNSSEVKFDDIISAETIGAFKPHPSVYSTAAHTLDVEPRQIMMVASHSFDILGARASGYRAAYINRYDLPYEETPLQPDIVTNNLVHFASLMVEGLDS